MARPRTGSLVWRKSGWSARYWALGLRLCVPLGTSVREHAERKLRALLTSGAKDPSALAAVKPARQAMKVLSITLECAVCLGSVEVRGEAALGQLRRGKRFYCKNACKRRARYEEEVARKRLANSPAGIAQLAVDLQQVCKKVRDNESEQHTKNDGRKHQKGTVAGDA